MRIRFPLYARMLTWFFLNLVLLAVIALVFFKAEGHIRLSSLFLGQAEERMQSVGEVINAELNQSPPAEWNRILKLFSDSYHLRFYLFRNDGQQLAGSTVTLPREIRSRVERPPRNGPRPSVRSDGRPNPDGRPNIDPPALLLPPEGQPDEEFRRPRRSDGPEENNRQFNPPDRRRAGEPPAVLISTANPHQYWAVIRMGVGGGTNSVVPAILLAASNSLSGGGLFVDYKPWIVVTTGAILISILFWIPLARGLTQSLSQLTHVTEEIAAGRFQARADIRRGDELGRLGQSVNQMAERLNGFVTGQKRFLGDTAHELCSPIARIQLALGILEQKADPRQEATLADLREEIQHLGELVNELLSFSKASLQPASVRLRPVPLRSLVEQAIQRETDEDVKTLVHVEETLTASADPDLLSRALCNLLRNATRYASHAGPITVSAESKDDKILLRVTDCGPGIPEEAISKIFDPFYRPESSRDRETGGVGLGLAIVKTCIESCHGDVACRNLKPNGFEVTLKLQRVKGV